MCEQNRGPSEGATPHVQEWLLQNIYVSYLKATQTHLQQNMVETKLKEIPSKAVVAVIESGVQCSCELLKYQSAMWEEIISEPE